MNRILTVCLALVLLVASSSFATTTRLLTLGQQYDIVMDDANIFRYPSRLLNYPKLFVGEIGYASTPIASSDGLGLPSYSGLEFQKLGVHWQFRGEENPWVLGTYFHNSETQGASIDLNGLLDIDLFDYIGFDEDVLPNQKLDVFFAKKLGGTTPFGAHFKWIHSSITDEFGGEEDFKEGFSSYKLNLGVTLNEGNTDVSLGVQMWSWSDKFLFAEYVDETKPSGNIAFSLQGRHFMARSNNYTLVPHAGIMYRKHGIEYFDAAGDPEGKITGSLMTINVGSGLNWTPAEDVLAVLDGGIRYSGGKYTEEPEGGPEAEAKANELALFYFKLGAEAEMFPWMTVRGGATSDWDMVSWSSGEGDTESKTSFKYADNQTYLGLGFLWGGWHIDTYIDPAWVLAGPYFISGDGNTMNWQVSLLRPF